jgi:hypothetical protein
MMVVTLVFMAIKFLMLIKIINFSLSYFLRITPSKLGMVFPLKYNPDKRERSLQQIDLNH